MYSWACLHGFVRTSSGSKPVAVGRKHRLKHRRQHLRYRLLDVAGLALSVSPTASPLRPASVSLPASRGLADTSRFREPPALPTSALSGSPQVFHRHPVYPRCSPVALYSLQRSPQVLSFKHCFPHCHVGFSLVSCRGRLGPLLQLPQASPASLAQQSPYPQVSAFLVRPSNCSTVLILLDVRPFPTQTARYYGLG